MPGNAADEAFARTVNQMGAATLEDIEAAKAAQAEAARGGLLLSFADVMVQRGTITQAMRESVEKRMQAQQAGGIQALGQYKLLRKLGEGGMGSVFLAEDRTLQRQVALKVLARRHVEDADFLKRFRREAIATGKLNHANIVSAHTVGEELGHHFYVMEYCDGETLEQILRRDHILPWDWAVNIVMQVARGLRHAHERGFIHRDIKPGNIMVTKDGVAKILDLGMSKNIGNSAQHFTTETGVALGTPHYISPEQAAGNKDLDGRTDIYSLGVTLYHAVTGQTPFAGETAAVIMTKHINEQAPDPQDVCGDIPDGVAQVIRKMLAKNPADRYADCQELLDDLQLVIAGKMPGSQALDGSRSSVASRTTVPAGRRVDTRAPRPPQPIATRAQQPVEQRGKRTVSPSPERKRLYIAAGIAVAGVIIFGVGLFCGGSPEPETPETAKASTQAGAKTTATRNERTVTPAPSSAALEKAAPPPGPPAVDDPARWRAAVPLLSLIDLQKAVVSGTWLLGNGKLVSDATGDRDAGGARLEVPYAPPDEYDVRVTFTRTRITAADGGGDIVLVLPRSGRQLAWVMGGFGNTKFGFETIEGRRVNTSPTSVTRPGGIENGQPYTCIVCVRKDGVKAYLDGVLVTQCRTSFADATLEASWKLRSTQVLGLATYGSPTVFQRLELLEVSGKGKFVRPSEPVAKAPEPKTVAGGGASVPPPPKEAVAAGDTAAPPVEPMAAAAKEIAAAAKAAVAIEFLSKDINTKLAGTTEQVGADGYNVTAAGDDIWFAKDGFRFVYQRATGDFDIRARIASVENTNEWAKVGLMVRQSLTPGAAHAALNATAEHGCMFQRRIEAGADATYNDCGPFSPDKTWLRVSRSGKAVAAYLATDDEGKKWKRVGSDVIDLADPVLVGLCVCSHDGGKLCKGEFRSVTLTTGAAPQP